MNASNRKALVLGGILCFLQVARTSGQYIDVEVNLFQKPSGELYSSAYATCYDFFFHL